MVESSNELHLKVNSASTCIYGESQTYHLAVGPFSHLSSSLGGMYSLRDVSLESDVILHHCTTMFSSNVPWLCSWRASILYNDQHARYF